jgi:hypothetical protein
MCAACKNFNNRREVRHGVEPTCNAYPEGIPWRYYYGGDNHTDPEGDGVDDIAFELDPERTFALDSWVRFWYVPVPTGIDEGEAVADQSTVIE